MGQRGGQIVQVRSNHGGSGVDDDIASDTGQDWEKRASRDFAEAALTTISDDRRSDFLRYRDTEAHLVPRGFEDEERKEWRMQSHTPVVYEPKFSARAKRLNRLSGCHQTIGLNSDSVSTACAPSRDVSSARDDPPSCSFAREIHVSSRGDGCWAGMYASLELLPLTKNPYFRKR